MRISMRAMPPVVLSLVLAVLAAVHPARSAAQMRDTERSALARSLFREGVELAEQERFGEAADRFRRAHELRPTPGLAYNLASALARDGELVEAAELLRGVRRSPEASREIRMTAEKLLEETEPRIPHLTVEVQGAADSVQVRLDDRNLEAAAVGVAVPVDPGEHTVELRRGAELVASETVHAKEGTSVELSLDAGERPDEPQQPPGEPEVEARPAVAHVAVGGDGADARDDGDGGSILGTWWFWTGAVVVAAGAVAAGLVLGGVFDEPEPIEGNTMPGVLEWR